MSQCLFCQMLAGDIETDQVYEDEAIFAFKDINPQAPFHVLIIPKIHIATLNELQPEHAALVGRMSLVAKDLAMAHGYAERGFRTVFNCNSDAGQAVYHIHLHLLAGRILGWPPG